jgi:glycosyltransferase involved in cell wall biosynthesis
MHDRVAPQAGTRSVEERAGGARAQHSCLLILGMHRSGTSALARVASLMGAELPKTLIPANPSNESGHWEPERLVDVHDRLLTQVGSFWDDCRAVDLAKLPPETLSAIRRLIGGLLQEEYAEAPLFVLKDPRICRLVPFYVEIFEQRGITPLPVLTVRNPIAVAESLAKRNGMTEDYSALLWLRHVIEAEHATRNMPRRIVSYEDLLSDWHDVVQNISDGLGLGWENFAPETADAITAFLRPELRHHSTDIAEMQSRTGIWDYVQQAYDAHLELMHDSDSKSAFERMDAIRTEMDSVGTQFWDVMLHELAARRELVHKSTGTLAARRREIDRLTTILESRPLEERDHLLESRVQAAEAAERALMQALEVEHLDAELRRSSDRSADLLRALLKAESECDALRSELADCDAEITPIRQAVDVETAAAARLKAALVERDAGLQQHRNQIEHLEHELEANQSQIADLKSTAATHNAQERHLKRAIGHRDTVIAAIYGSTSWRAAAPLRGLKRNPFARAKMPTDAKTSRSEHERRPAPAAGKRAIASLRAEKPTSAGGRFAMICHVYYPELAAELAEYVGNIKEPFDLYVTVAEDLPPKLAAQIQGTFPEATIIPVRNMGRDCGALLQALPTVLRKDYSLICKIHSKQGNKYPETWRRMLLRSVLGSAEQITAIVQAFAQTPDLWLVGSRELYLSGPSWMIGNAPQLQSLMGDRQRKLTDVGEWGFFAGTMFWGHRELFEHALAAVCDRSFELDNSRDDGQLAHALERFFGLLPHLHDKMTGFTSSVEPSRAIPVVTERQPVGHKKSHEISRILRNSERVEEILASGLFDHAWYARQPGSSSPLHLSPALHYVDRGAEAGLSPNPSFDTSYYRNHITNTGERRLNPLLHYIRIGSRRGLRTTSSATALPPPHAPAEAQPPAPQSRGAVRDAKPIPGEVRQAPQTVQHRQPLAPTIPAPSFTFFASAPISEQTALRHAVLSRQPGTAQVPEWSQSAREREVDAITDIVASKPERIRSNFLESQKQAIAAVQRNLRHAKDAEHLQAALHDSISNNNELMQALVAREVEIVPLKESLQAHSGALATLKQALYEKVRDTDELKATLAKCNTKLQDCTKKVEDMRRTLQMGTREVRQLKAVVVEREHHLRALLRTRDAREAHVAALRGSTSWRITAPLRDLRQAGTTLSQVLRAISSGMTRAAYRAVPVSMATKMRLKGRLFRASAPLLRNTVAYRDWEVWEAAIRAARAPIPAPAAIPLSEAAANAKGNAAKASTPKPAPPMFRDLLIRSLFSHTMSRPYTVEDEYFIAYMSAYGRQLAERYKSRQQGKLVSIVMPTFNRADCIGDAIRSTMAQTYQNWELIIADDCSTDGTAEVVKSFADPRINYVRLNSNRGAAGARNVALEHASGEFITYLDSDNTMDRNFLLILANELENNPDFDIVYCAQRAFTMQHGNEEEEYVRFGAFHRASLENSNYIDLGTLMHSHSLIDRFGCFDAQMKRLSDWEYLLRCATGTAARAVPAILSNYYSDKAANRISDIEKFEMGQDSIDERIGAAAISKALPHNSLPGLEKIHSLPYAVPPPSARPPVSIVIPNYEAEEYLRACVDSIYAFTQETEFELIIVDNASSPSAVDYLRELEADGRARVILNPVNRGFTFAVNQGIEAAAAANDIVIINNDAVVTSGWMDGLQAVVASYPDVGLVMPRQVVLPGEPTLLTHQPRRNPLRECDVNISVHHNNVLDPLFDAPKGYIEVSFAPFFCTYIPRSTLRIVGPLDVESGPHYRSDRLYCDLVREVAGRRLIYTPHSKVYHFVQRATADLKKSDAALYKDMFVKNDWAAIKSRN